MTTINQNHNQQRIPVYFRLPMFMEKHGCNQLVQSYESVNLPLLYFSKESANHDSEFSINPEKKAPGDFLL